MSEFLSDPGLNDKEKQFVQACKEGKYDDVKKCLDDYTLDICVEDKSGLASIDYAINNKRLDCAALITSEAFYRFNEENHKFRVDLRAELQNEDNGKRFNEKLFRRAIENDPQAASKYLSRFMSKSDYEYEFTELDKIFGLNGIRTSALAAVVNDSIIPSQMDLKLDCLQHVVLKRVLDIKWELYGARKYYQQLLVYILVLITMTNIVASNHAQVIMAKTNTTEIINDIKSELWMKSSFFIWVFTFVLFFVGSFHLYFLKPRPFIKLTRWMYDGKFRCDPEFVIPHAEVFKSKVHTWLFTSSLIWSMVLSGLLLHFLKSTLEKAEKDEDAVCDLIYYHSVLIFLVLWVCVFYFLIQEIQELYGENPWIYTKIENASWIVKPFWVIYMVCILPFLSPFMISYRKYYASFTNKLQLLTYILILAPFAYLHLYRIKTIHDSLDKLSAKGVCAPLFSLLKIEDPRQINATIAKLNMSFGFTELNALGTNYHLIVSVGSNSILGKSLSSQNSAGRSSVSFSNPYSTAHKNSASDYLNSGEFDYPTISNNKLVSSGSSAEHDKAALYRGLISSQNSAGSESSASSSALTSTGGSSRNPESSGSHKRLTYTKKQVTDILNWCAGYLFDFTKQQTDIVYFCIGAFCTISLWMLSLQYLQVNSTAGYLLPIVKDVLGDVWDFFIFYGVFQCGLTCAFYFIFQKGVEGYETLWASFCSTYFVMYGDNGVSDLIKNTTQTEDENTLTHPVINIALILRMFHAAVMVVLLLNLLLAMMNKTVDRNWEKLQSRAMTSYAHAVLRLETMLGHRYVTQAMFLQSDNGNQVLNPIFKEKVSIQELSKQDFASDDPPDEQTELKSTVVELTKQNKDLQDQLNELTSSVRNQLQDILRELQEE